jgi:uncharacterized protein (TIRG00374 family)
VGLKDDDAGAPGPSLDRVARTGIWVGLSGLLILVALGIAVSRTDQGAAAMVDIWARTRPLPLAGSIAVMTGAVGFLALRWRALIPGGEHLEIPGMMGIVCAGMLMNVALPGPVGEVGSAMLVKRRFGIPATTALAAGIHARFLGLSAAGTLALLAWALGDLPIPEEAEGLIGGVAVFIALFAMALGALSIWPKLLDRLSTETAGRLGRLPGLPGRGFAKLDETVRSTAAALGEVGRQSPSRWAWALTWSLGSHFSVTAGIWLGSHALGMDAHLPGILFTYCAATAGIVALYALPAAMAGWDALFCAFFVTTTGVTLTDAVAMTALVRTQQLLLLLLGAIFLGSEAKRA